MYHEVRKLCNNIASEVEPTEPKLKKIDSYSEWCDFTDEDDEVNLYLMESCFIEADDILIYWQSKQRVFPKLSILAKKILSIRMLHPSALSAQRET